MRERYRIDCVACGEIEADSDDGLYTEATAQRRAGFHEGSRGGEHSCRVQPVQQAAQEVAP